MLELAIAREESIQKRHVALYSMAVACIALGLFECGFPVSELLVSAPRSSSPGDELLGKAAKSSETGNPLK